METLKFNNHFFGPRPMINIPLSKNKIIETQQSNEFDSHSASLNDDIKNLESDLVEHNKIKKNKLKISNKFKLPPSSCDDHKNPLKMITSGVNSNTSETSQASRPKNTHNPIVMLSKNELTQKPQKKINIKCIKRAKLPRKFASLTRKNSPASSIDQSNNSNTKLSHKLVSKRVIDRKSVV